MKITTLFGILLIILGALALGLKKFSYTENETVFNMGSVKATAEHKKTIPIPAVAGGVAIVSGIVLMVAERAASLARVFASSPVVLTGLSALLIQTPWCRLARFSAWLWSAWQMFRTVQQLRK